MTREAHPHETALRAARAALLRGALARLIGPDARIHPDTLWSCTTCRACVEECPMMIEHVDAIVDMRRHLTLEKGATPNKGAEVLDNLIENAIKYGVSPSRRPVTLRVEARRERNRLRIDVIDDGDAATPATCGTGVGLRNVRDRLKLRFAGEEEMSYGRLEDGGFGVTLRMPLVLNDC